MSNSRELRIIYEYADKGDHTHKRWTISGHKDMDTWESMIQHWNKRKPTGSILLRIILEAQ